MIRVMLAEDNWEMRRDLSEYLGQKPEIDLMGMASNGTEAETLIRKNIPDVLLLDLVMPMTDGFALMEHIRGTPGGDAIKMIVLTALTRDALIRRAMELGACYYMVKPFDPELLYSRIVQFSGDRARSTPKKSDRIERTSALLTTLGIPKNNKGFLYLHAALVFALEQSDGRMTKRAYPALAARYGVTPASVERAMRGAIETAWNRGGMRSAFFPNRERRPSNGEFIAKILEALRYDGICEA